MIASGSYSTEKDEYFEIPLSEFLEFLRKKCPSFADAPKENWGLRVRIRSLMSRYEVDFVMLGGDIQEPTVGVHLNYWPNAGPPQSTVEKVPE